MMKNYLKFWGTRGSCPVSGSEYAEFGGNTCTLQLRYEDSVLIFDAGTGIRELGFELMRQNVRNIHLFFSHSHWDHLIGLPFFQPVYEPGVKLTIWTPPNIRRSYRELIEDLLSPEFFPVKLEQINASLEFKTIQQKTPITLGKVTLDFHSAHHPGLAFGFKIRTPEQTFGYFTDNEMLHGYHGPLSEIPKEVIDPHQSLIEFLMDCDVLIHEAQYTSEEYLHKVGWGHSSSRNAIYLLLQTKIPKWLVTHHDPSHTDLDLHAQEAAMKKELQELGLSCKVQWVGDGFIWQIKK